MRAWLATAKSAPKNSRESSKLGGPGEHQFGAALIMRRYEFVDYARKFRHCQAGRARSFIAASSADNEPERIFFA
jgi:hypothetical protein